MRTGCPWDILCVTSSVLLFVFQHITWTIVGVSVCLRHDDICFMLYRSVLIQKYPCYSNKYLL